MHNKQPNIYYFINNFDPNHINKIDKKVSLIYRNYKKNTDENLIKKIKFFCKKKKIKFFLANNIKLAIKLDLDGAYIPAFNKDIRHNAYMFKKKFIILGSAHNLKEINAKEKQGVKVIFISSLFRKKQSYLGMNKFNNLIKLTSKKIIALGGINKKNLKKIKLLKIYGYAAINLFQKKTAP